jgi:hypothetical protein
MQVVLLDDPFGASQFVYSEYQAWSHAVLKLKEYGRQRHTLSIVVIRDTVLADADFKTNKHKLLGKSPVFDMARADPLSPNIRTAILKNHAQHNDKTLSEVSSRDIASRATPNDTFLRDMIEFVLSDDPQPGPDLFRERADQDVGDGATDDSLETLMNALHTSKKIMDALQLERAAGDEGYVHKPVLHLAVTQNDLQAARFLLDCKVDVDSRDSSAATALLHAASHGFADVAQLLLERGANPNAAQTDGWAPLHFAASKGMSDIVQLLVRFQADVKQCTLTADTSLHLAVTSGDVDTVSALLQADADPTARDQQSRTPLHLAAFHGHAAITQLLLDHGADIEAQTRATKATPLHVAVYEDNPEVTQLLLERGANREHRASYKWREIQRTGGRGKIP